MSERTIDFSRYRVAEAIAERWAVGEADDAARDYFSHEVHDAMGEKFGLWIVEMIAAAHDRKGKYEPK